MNTPPDSTRFIACPLCGTLVKPENEVQDPRWANPVHEKCVQQVESWPTKARDPRGRYGMDDFYDR